MTPPSDRSDWPQSLRAAHLVLDALVERGLRELVLCPGSRSAPVAYAADALARAGRLRLHVRIDERGAAFLALGLAKGWQHSDGKPVLRAAVVTTSGTAVANLHPALLEASHSQIPMLALTADRPASLRGTGANQTTWQPGIFQQVRIAFDVPTDAVGVGSTRALADKLTWASCGDSGTAGGGWPGPVHLNLCLVEPLAPAETSALVGFGDAVSGDDGDGDYGGGDDGGGDDGDYGGGGGDLMGRYAVPGVPPAHTTPWHRQRELPGGRPVLAANAPSGRRGVVVAGDSAGARAAEFAIACGYPLLAEPSSQARWGNAVGAYQWLLASPLAEAVDEVVVFGHPTLSRPVSRLLARADVPVTVITQGDDWTDVSRRARVASAIDVPGSPVADSDWLEQWRRAASDQLAVSGPVAAMASRGPNPRLGDAWAARVVQLVTEHSADGRTPLLLGASQVIRWADLFAPCPADQPTGPVFASRGLAGIDGSIATAQGAALALGVAGRRPMRALIGDLTFWHDVGSLNRGRLESYPDLQIVVINDSGGSIFGRLEHGRAHLADHFERLFAVPQMGSITQVASGFGLAATRIENGDEAGLIEVLGQRLEGVSVVEVIAGR